jgi:hypothetical protein
MAYNYLHFTLDTDELFYTGMSSTKDKKRAYTKRGRNPYWKNIVNKHGFRVEILSDNLTKEQAIKEEIKLIAWYGRKSDGGCLVNMTLGGEGTSGNVPHNKGKESPLKGKPRSEETLKKIREAAEKRRGVSHTKEHRENLSKAHLGNIPWNKGIPHTEEHKQNLSKAQRRRYGWY